jgi:HNH/Endo VII superfamily nuclease toxins
LVPISQSFISQWANGNDTSKAGSSNYVLKRIRQASWGNYYLYKVGTKYFVIAEHINDPDAPCPKDWAKPCKHFHVGIAEKNNTSFLQSKTPDATAIEFFKSKDYDQVGTNHHYFYKGN